MADADYSNEIWKDIPGLVGWYQASSEGRIKSLARSTPTRNRWGPCIYNAPEKVIAGRIDGDGYKRMTLCVAGKVKAEFAHKLVALAFIGVPSFQGAQIAHWDGDKLNNSPGNLRWATARENSQDKVRHGTTANQFGERHSHNKLTEDQVREIRRTAYFRGFDVHFSAKFGVRVGTINKIRHRLRWPHIE